MKRILVFICLVFFLAGCQKAAEAPSATATPTPDTADQTSTSAKKAVRYDLIIIGPDFGVDEMFVQKDEPLIISLRNQIDEPVNITIDGLPIHSENVEKGHMIEVTVPTNIPGEYEVYSSVGNQRNEGFSTLLTIEE